MSYGPDNFQKPDKVSTRAPAHKVRSAKCLPASLGSYGPDQILSHYSEIRAFVYPNIRHVTISGILPCAHIYCMSTPPNIESLPDAAWIYAFSRIPGIGNKTILSLIRTFGSGKAAWDAVIDTGSTLSDIRPQAIRALRDTLPVLEPDRLWQELHTLGVTPIGYTDNRYPALLREIPDAPPILYVRGTYDWHTHHPMITIVGTRKPSVYGRQVAQDFARRLSQAGCTIISGLAFGVDGLAHEATLENGGRTIAVIGSGIDDASIAPQSHLALAHRIMEHDGAVMSEFVPGTTVTVGTFPARNRIMAGMSPLTLVIEAGEQSGTLITARLALEYNRDVCAVPGSIFAPGAVGCHRLIQRGAKLVTSIEDILEELPRLSPDMTNSESPTPTLPDHEQVLFSLLSREPIHIDAIILRTKRPAGEIMALLTLLEMKGLAKNIGGMHYMRI